MKDAFGHGSVSITSPQEYPAHGTGITMALGVANSNAWRQPDAESSVGTKDPDYGRPAPNGESVPSGDSGPADDGVVTSTGFY
jgi:hypothetical protein